MTLKFWLQIFKLHALWKVSCPEVNLTALGVAYFPKYKMLKYAFRMKRLDRGMGGSLCGWSQMVHDEPVPEGVSW
jgi:hypothetical protein